MQSFKSLVSGAPFGDPLESMIGGTLGGIAVTLNGGQAEMVSTADRNADARRTVPI